MALFQRPEMPFADETPENINAPFSVRSAGDELRGRREALGLDLADVAAALRIKPAYLAALEAGHLDQLPGAVYALGFLRAYADYLGVDGGAMLRRFKRESALLAAKPDLAFPIPLDQRSMPGVGMLLVAVILATCAYGGWFYLSTGPGPQPERVVAVPAELLLNPDQLRAWQTVPRPAEQMAVPQPATGLTGPARSSPTDARSGSAPPPAATSAVAAVAGPAVAAPGPAPGARREVVIRASADSWIEIRDARRSVLLTRVLNTGESCRAPDRPGLSMRTGNAGGLEITIDGIPAPSIGRSGMVRHKVVLDAQALLAGSAVRD
jgi:cytoskeleton protein RodZ